LEKSKKKEILKKISNKDISEEELKSIIIDVVEEDSDKEDIKESANKNVKLLFG